MIHMLKFIKKGTDVIVAEPAAAIQNANNRLGT
jgi:hypothetical protein